MQARLHNDTPSIIIIAAILAATLIAWHMIQPWSHDSTQMTTRQPGATNTTKIEITTRIYVNGKLVREIRDDPPGTGLLLLYMAALSVKQGVPSWWGTGQVMTIDPVVCLYGTNTSRIDVYCGQATVTATDNAITVTASFNIPVTTTIDMVGALYTKIWVYLSHMIAINMTTPLTMESGSTVTITTTIYTPYAQQLYNLIALASSTNGFNVDNVVVANGFIPTLVISVGQDYGCKGRMYIESYEIGGSVFAVTRVVRLCGPYNATICNFSSYPFRTIYGGATLFELGGLQCLAFQNVYTMMDDGLSLWLPRYYWLLSRLSMQAVHLLHPDSRMYSPTY